MEPLTKLTNHLLIAMPRLLDPYFHHSVTFILEHNEKGAMGIIINQPLLNISLGSILEEMKITCDIPDVKERLVYAGGPVHPERGFVIHKKEANWQSTIHVSPDISVTTSPDILKAIAEDKGPLQSFIALGYASWQPGQLEQEIMHNSWIYGDISPHLLFDIPYQDRWRYAASSAGIDVDRLSDDVGHA